MIKAVKVPLKKVPNARPLYCDACDVEMNNHENFYAIIYENKNREWLESFVCQECFEKFYKKESRLIDFENTEEPLKEKILETCYTPPRFELISMSDELTFEEYEKFFEESWEKIRGSSLFITILKIKIGNNSYRLMDFIRFGIVSPVGIAYYLHFTGKDPTFIVSPSLYIAIIEAGVN